MLAAAAVVLAASLLVRVEHTDSSAPREEAQDVAPAGTSYSGAFSRWATLS